MYDLYLVAIGHGCVGPVNAADHCIIYLDRNTLFWERKQIEQSLQIKMIGNFMTLAIELDVYHSD